MPSEVVIDNKECVILSKEKYESLTKKQIYEKYKGELLTLEEAIENFAGCVLVISHDRWFIDRLATHILAFEDDSQVVFFEGNFSDYEKAKLERLGNVTPRRPRFKSLL